MPGHGGTTQSSSGEGRITEATISRMRWYLHILDDYARRGVPIIASHEIAGAVGIKSGLVRKDLSQFGGFGRPSVGYNVIYLQRKLREILRVEEPQQIAWVGVEHFTCIGDRIRHYAERNCPIVAVFDPDPEWIGKVVMGVEIMHPDRIEQVVRKMGIRAAIILPTRESAQAMAERLVAGGVEAILNLSQSALDVPPGVFVRNLDVAGELLTLSYLAREWREAAQDDAS